MNRISDLYNSTNSDEIVIIYSPYRIYPFMNRLSPSFINAENFRSHYLKIVLYCNIKLKKSIFKRSYYYNMV